jgi:hypothetical protein
VIGESINTAFRSVKWSGPVGHILNVAPESKAFTETLNFQKDETTLLNVKITVFHMQESLICVLRDVTAMVTRCSSPSLVPRVQAGEKNISFAVSVFHSGTDHRPLKK